ncbi:MAG TPA: 5-formyltetrahydrofolate cyclo-ligase [Candidatus Omnitrophota bacterium]|nr:5-formyltetrahydrofolate cyclo-ligase [Candidatus Omnitrophota bacterium]HPN56038.1 5-formyltetrahydrofolate cyclo-ligase [Candidatus Omnitrophota bacterium]
MGIIEVTERLKKEIRKQVLNDLRNQKEEERLRKSLVIQERLFALPEFFNSKTILFYVSFDGEVETSDMMKQAKNIGKTIGLPYIFKKTKQLIPVLIGNLENLEVGPYGIKQPSYDPELCLVPEEIDLCVVPGVAFDRARHRLGRGAGYYDRFLPTLPPRTHTIGLAFQFQVFDCLPTQDHDVPVSHLIYD